MKPKRVLFLRKFGSVVRYSVVFFLLSLVLYWSVYLVFTIKTIVVASNTVKVLVDQSRLPKSLILFPSAKIRAELLTDNPILADIQFQKKYPHTLVIVPTLRTAVVRLNLNEREVLLDESGIVLMDATNTSLPLPRLFVSIPVVRIGETIRDSRVTAGISFIMGIQPMLTIQTIHVEDDRSLRAKSDTLDIVFPQDADMRGTLATLQTLLAGFRIKGTLPAFIDLRFNKPIIKF
jgi:Cell division protein FtsQ